MELEPMWMRGMSPHTMKRAKEELGEMEDYKAQCLTKFKKMVAGEDGFEPLMSDTFLLRFLRAKKFDVKRAHKTLKNYYAYKLRYSGLLTDFGPADVADVLDTDCIFVSPKRCPQGCGILIVFVGSFDVGSMSAEQLIAASVVTAEIGIETEGSQINGSQVVIDLKGMTLAKMRSFSNPILLSRLFRGVQDCWPYRITAIHGIHEPPYYGTVYSVIKTMLSKKLRDRVHLHGDNMASLHKFLPPETLPKQFGGTLGEKDFLNFKTVIQENGHIMENINKYRIQGQKSPKYDSSCADGDHSLVVPSVLQATC